MTFVRIEPRKRYNNPDILATYNVYKNAQKITFRFQNNILDLLNIKTGDRLSISFNKENPKIFFLEKDDKGYKLSVSNRLIINSPFLIDKKQIGINVPYELKDNGIYLYFDKTSAKEDAVPSVSEDIEEAPIEEDVPPIWWNK